MDAEEEEEEPVIEEEFDISTSNPRYGITDYDALYECTTCCFCARVIPSTVAKQERKVYVDKCRPPRPTKWQRAIDRRISVMNGTAAVHWNLSIILGYRLQLHTVCSRIMTPTELKQLHEHSKDASTYVPGEHDYGVHLNLDYAGMIRAGSPVPRCDYCDDALSSDVPGLRYPVPGQVRLVKFLHFGCHDKLLRMQGERVEQQKQSQQQDDDML
jgi:hypothetical protein